MTRVKHIDIITAMKKIQNTNIPLENKLENQQETKLVIIFESIIVGMLAGLVVALFRKGIDLCLFWMTYLYDQASLTSGNSKQSLYIVLSILILSFMGLIIGFLIKKFPMIKGSGISQLKGNFLQKMPFLPIAELPLKFIGGILCIGSGMSVGKAGPSIQLGAYLGSIFERIGKTSHTEKICLITSGATAGLSAIFGAPFASMLFAIEGLHQYLSPLLLTCVMSGALSGKFMVSLFFGNGSIFNFPKLNSFPIKYYGWLILLGILTAITALILKKTIYIFQKLFNKIKLIELRPLIPFLLILPIYLILPLETGGGDKLIFALINNELSFKIICVILLVKILFTGLCLGSGSIGGLFFPALTCGALLGMIFAKILIYFNLIEAQYATNIMIFAMTAFFTGLIKAPITGIILLAEIGADFSHMEGIIISGLTAFIIAQLFNSHLDEELSANTLIKESELHRMGIREEKDLK